MCGSSSLSEHDHGILACYLLNPARTNLCRWADEIMKSGSLGKHTKVVMNTSLNTVVKLEVLVHAF